MKKIRADKRTRRRTKKLWLIKLALNIAGRKMLKELNKASKDSKKAQHKILMDILDYAKDTEYGKKHGFRDIKTVEDFRKNVPVNNYEDLRPYIMRHTRGEENLLFPGKPIMYATTSGTTKEPKWIPITEKYYKESYNGLTRLWFYSVLKEIPDIFDGPELSIVGRDIEGYTEDGTAYGSFSGHVHKNIPEFLKNVHVVPAEIHNIEDYYSRYYCLLRFTIEYHIRFIITGNPSTLIEMQKVVDKRIDELIEDIEKGTLSRNLKLPSMTRELLEKSLSPNPRRAESLRLLRAEHIRLLPKHYWPTLSLINTWKCGNSGLYLKHLDGFYPEDTKIREFSYMATEARAGIILKNDKMASILAAHLLYYEFIRLEDREKENPRIYSVSELEEGGYYYLIVTTSGGLYRYDINDILRVDGFYNDFPELRFIQKGVGITNLTGEKLHERQLLLAVKQTESELKIKNRFYICFADIDVSGYRLFAEFDEKIMDNDLKKYCFSVDEKLKKMNIEYKSKRESHRIKPLVLHRLLRDSFEKFKLECMKRGSRDGQFKLVHLIQNDLRMEMFKKLSYEGEISFGEDW